MNKISRIYVIHYTKLLKRKEYMQWQINKWNLQNVSFYEEFDQEQLNFLDIEENIDNISSVNKNGILKLPEISLAIKYKNILKEISKSKDGEYFLILEDDVIFKEDPNEYINKIIEHCENNNIEFDAVFMGEAGLRIGDNRDCFYKKEHPATNGLCTVLYTKKAVQKIFDELNKNKISRPIDWEFNFLFEKLDLQIYWAKAITRHGSVAARSETDFSFFKSSLR